MRGRTLLTLIAILVVLAGIGFLFEATRHRATHVSQETVFKGLKTDQVDRIRILYKGKDAILERKDGKWLVATEGMHPAEPKYVTDILDRLPKYYSDEIVSTNPANQSLFMVDSSGVEVWVNQSGKEIGHFFVGKPGPDFLSTYVRPAGTNKVILVPDYLPNLFQRTDTWRERTIFQIDENDIRSYEYESPSRGHLLMKKDDKGLWHMETPDTGLVEASRIAMALRSFSSLKAAGFADTISAAAAGIDADTSKISVGLADGSTQILKIGRPTEANRSFARKEGSDQIVVVPRGALNTMMASPAALKPAPGASPGMEFQTPGGTSSSR